MKHQGSSKYIAACQRVHKAGFIWYSAARIDPTNHMRDLMAGITATNRQWWVCGERDCLRD